MSMDPRLLRAYNDELAYLRESAREFGNEHEVVAGHLGLKTPSDPDPYVERLLEGVAFLSARVHLKLEDEFPEFTQHLLNAVQPNYLAPTPSMCVVGLTPRLGDDTVLKGAVIPRHTDISVGVAGNDTPVRFRTGHDVSLHPIVIAEAEYLGSRAAVASYAAAADVRADAGLRIRFRGLADVPLSAVCAKSLPIYLAGTESVPGELYRQLLGETVAVVARSQGQTHGGTRLPKPEPFGLGEEEALLPGDGRSFRGYRVLAEYFACPERFLFVTLPDVAKAFSAASEACDVVVLFRQSSPVLTNAITASNLRLFAVPAVNLFEMQLGRVPTPPTEHEHLVLPDRTRPLDFEVFRILSVTAQGATGGARPVAPLYSFGALLYDWQDALFYVTRIVRRRLSTREQRRRRRTDYTGSHTFISLTAPGNPDRVSEIRELAVRALVTNRELPEMLRFGGPSGHLHIDAPSVEAVEILRAPTRPRPALGLSDSAWRVVGHLTPNFRSLLECSPEGVPLFRDHLALYGRADDPALRRQIDGVLSLHAQSVTRRIDGMDRIAFARGHHIEVQMDDASFDNGRMFLFATVIDRFFSEFASINSFTETVFRSPALGEFCRWPARIGLRPTI